MHRLESLPDEEGIYSAIVQPLESLSKRHYSPPILTDFGRIEDLTLELNLGPADGGPLGAGTNTGG